MKTQIKNQMSRELLTVQSETSVGEAYRLMTNEWIRHLPVVSDDEHTVIGMVSDRDLLCAKSDELPVKAVMNHHLKSCDIDTPIREVVHSMIDNKISSYLITHDGSVQGIITSEDMLLLLSQFLNQEDQSEMSLKKWMTNPVAQNAVHMLSQAGI